MNGSNQLINLVLYNAHENYIAIISGNQAQNNFPNDYFEQSLYWKQPLLRTIPSLTQSKVRQLTESLKHIGLFYDQLLQVHPESDGVIPYHIHNADGSYAAQCGNGARSLIAHLAESTSQDSFMLLSPSNRQFGRVLQDQSVEVEVGVTSTDRDELIQSGILVNKLNRSADGRYLLFLPLLEKTIPVHLISAGNPHAIFNLHDITDQAGDIDILSKIGQYCNTECDIFPHGVNVSFYEPMQGDAELQIIIYERGVGFTGSCGTALISVYSAIWESQEGLRQVCTTNPVTKSRNVITIKNQRGVLSLIGSVVKVGEYQLSI
ncbi:MAG: hypothetical protein QM538_03240 [Methylacidiphilales bacterium]|nr:hypothetical protein [Candidatus Methylacidiphilales bacterium]